MSLFTIDALIYFQILRVQSPEGTKRIEVLPSDTISRLYEKVTRATAYLSLCKYLLKDNGIYLCLFLI